MFRESNAAPRVSTGFMENIENSPRSTHSKKRGIITISKLSYEVLKVPGAGGDAEQHRDRLPTLG